MKMLNFIDPINEKDFETQVGYCVKRGYKQTESPIALIFQNEVEVIIVYKFNA